MFQGTTSQGLTYLGHWRHLGGVKSQENPGEVGSKVAKTTVKCIDLQIRYRMYGTRTELLSRYFLFSPPPPSFEQRVDLWHQLEATALLAIKNTLGGRKSGSAYVSMLHVSHVTISLFLSLASSIGEESSCNSHLNSLILENSMDWSHILFIIS